MKNKPAVILMGPVPPPYMGPSLATEILLNSKLVAHFRLIHLDTSDHRPLTKLAAVDFANIYLALKHYLVLFWLVVSQWPAIVYIPISQTTIGYIRDAGFVLIAKFLGRKVVCHLRGGYFGEWYASASRQVQWFVRRVHAMVDGQIVLGESLRRSFEGLMDSSRIFEVPNGRDFEIDSACTKGNHPLQVLYLGNLVPSKGVLDLLKAVPYVCALHPEVDFTFAGSFIDEVTRKTVDDFCRTFPALPVHFDGPVYGNEKMRLLRSSDIFVFPTYYPYEGHPWVIVEAMAFGLPIISTDQGAITESVIDGVNGFIVDKQNPEQIAEKINLLMQNAELRLKMGKESRRLYEEKFTEEKMVERLSHAFNAVLSDRCAG